MTDFCWNFIKGTKSCSSNFSTVLTSDDENGVFVCRLINSAINVKQGESSFVLLGQRWHPIDDGCAEAFPSLLFFRIHRFHASGDPFRGTASLRRSGAFPPDGRLAQCGASFVRQIPLDVRQPA